MMAVGAARACLILQTSPFSVLTKKGAASGTQAGPGTAHRVYMVAGMRTWCMERPWPGTHLLLAAGSFNPDTQGYPLPKPLYSTMIASHFCCKFKLTLKQRVENKYDE